MKIAMTVNRTPHTAEVPAYKRLLDVLREDLRLTGTKEGCGEGECGACTVLIDGEPVNSCLVAAGQCDGRHVATIEGLGGGSTLHAVQRALVDLGGTQCGICTPGMLVAAAAIPRRAKRAQIAEALAGNLCRCTGYSAIYRAILKVKSP